MDVGTQNLASLYGLANKFFAFMNPGGTGTIETGGDAGKNWGEIG